MNDQSGVVATSTTANEKRAEADYRYAHALYNMAERIRDRHPNAAIHLERAGDVVLSKTHCSNGTPNPDSSDWPVLLEERSMRRLSVTFHATARRPILPLPRPQG